MVIKIHFIEEFDLCEWETYNNGDTEDVKSWVWILESELNKAYKCCWFFISTNFIANKNSLTRIIKITLLLSIKSVFAVINNLWLIVLIYNIFSVFYCILIRILLLFKNNKNWIAIIDDASPPQLLCVVMWYLTQLCFETADNKKISLK